MAQRLPVEIVGIDLTAAGTSEVIDPEGFVVDPGRPGMADLLDTLKGSFGPMLYAFLKVHPTLCAIDFSAWADAEP